MQCMILIILWFSFSPSCLFYCYWLTFLFYNLDYYKIIDIIVPLSICMFSHICEMRFCTHYLLLLWQNACQIYSKDRRAYLGSWFEGLSPIIVGIFGTRSFCTSKEKSNHDSCSLPLWHLIPPRITAHGTLLPTSSVALSYSTKPQQKHPHKQAQRVCFWWWWIQSSSQRWLIISDLPAFIPCQSCS